MGWIFFSFALPPFNFHGRSEGGGRGASGSYSQQRRLFHVCQGVGTKSASDVLFPSFDCSVYVRRGTGGGAFGGSLPLTTMILVCMPVNWNDKRAGHVFIFFFRCSFFRD